MNKVKPWLLAARPKTLTAALIPVMLGAGLAEGNHLFRTDLALGCLAFAMLMQIASNLVNDLYDFLKGTDRPDRLGPARATAKGWLTPRAMRTGIGTVMSLAVVCGLGVLWLARPNLTYGGWELVAVGIVCLIFAFLYTTALSYRGWGDVLVLLFFGIVPVVGTYYVMGGSILCADAWILALVSGLSINTLLTINNYRDVEQDRVSGKRTLVVRFGPRFGRQFYLALGIAAVLLCVPLVFTGRLTWLEFIWAPCVYLYLHLTTFRHLCQIRQGERLNLILGETSRNMLFLGLLLAIAVAR